MTEVRHIAATWPELHAEVERRPDATLNIFTFLFGQVSKRAEDAANAGPDLWAAADALTGGAVLEDVEMMSALLELIVPRVSPIAETNLAGLQRDSASNFAGLALHDLVASGIGSAPAVDPMIFVERLTGREPHSEKFALRTVWAALAHGVHEPLRDIAPYDLSEAPPNLSVDLTGSESRIVDHFYRCVAHQTASEVIMPAWNAWVEMFPETLAAEWSSWPELLWSARAVHCVIGGAPENTLLDWLRSEIP